MIVRRAWTRTERRAVLAGLAARLLPALEPGLCAAVFLALAAGCALGPNAPGLALAFGLAALAFGAYAAYLLAGPLAALRRTFTPISIVDGYVRFRRTDRNSEPGSNGYVAVLDADRRTVAEWSSTGPGRLSDGLRPALVEFTLAGGIHRIDGRSAGAHVEVASRLEIER